jgi:transcriptional regulator GlxA family with amidase domain
MILETGTNNKKLLPQWEKARHLLATSFLNIKQIMAAVGYNSKGHFVRHFRKSFGLAPSKYRKSLNS